MHMTPANALHQMLRAPHAAKDPGDAGTIKIDRDRLYLSIVAATTETRTLQAPPQAGLVVHLGALDTQTVVVTVKDSGGSTTGTITFTAAGQWIGLVSAELTDGVYSWQATDVYGCTTTIQTAGNWSAAVADGSMTNLTVATAMTALAASIGSVTVGASNITALTGVFKSINCSTGLTAPAATIPLLVATSCHSIASVLATNLSVGTGATIPNIVASSAMSLNSGLLTNLSVATGATLGTILGTNITAPNITNASKLIQGGAIITSGGSTTAAAAASDCIAIGGPLVMISVASATRNYFKMPAAAVGLCVNVVNLGSTAGLLGAAGESIASATSVALATANAVGSGLDLICDGTNWWKRGI
jgi:hypothetical protein